jgi:hypothetical protein
MVRLLVCKSYLLSSVLFLLRIQVLHFGGFLEVCIPLVLECMPIFQVLHIFLLCFCGQKYIRDLEFIDAEVGNVEELHACFYVQNFEKGFIYCKGGGIGS